MLLPRMSPASTGRDLPGTEGPAAAPGAGFGAGAVGVEGKQAGEHFVADFVGPTPAVISSLLFTMSAARYL